MWKLLINYYRNYIEKKCKELHNSERFYWFLIWAETIKHSSEIESSSTVWQLECVCLCSCSHECPYKYEDRKCYYLSINRSKKYPIWQKNVSVCVLRMTKGGQKRVYSQDSERDTDSEMSQRPDLVKARRNPHLSLFITSGTSSTHTPARKGRISHTHTNASTHRYWLHSSKQWRTLHDIQEFV